MIGDHVLERCWSVADAIEREENVRRTKGIRREELTLYVRSFFFWTCQQLGTFTTLTTFYFSYVHVSNAVFLLFIVQCVLRILDFNPFTAKRGLLYFVLILI